VEPRIMKAIPLGAPEKTAAPAPKSRAGSTPFTRANPRQRQKTD